MAVTDNSMTGRPSLDIRVATPGEFGAVRHFYHRLIDLMEGERYAPGWKRGIYPATPYLRQVVDAGQLWRGTLGDEVISCMVLNHEANEGYAKVTWPTGASPAEALVLHAFGVLPTWQGHGFAKQMLDHAISHARGAGMRAMRLDAVTGSVPAERLYQHMGFRPVATIPLFYEDTGLIDYTLYELPL